MATMVYMRPLPSPTLTNPDLILPYGDTTRDTYPSPPLQPQRPPSPSQLIDKVQAVPLVAQVAERISLSELRQRRSMSPTSPQSFTIRSGLGQLHDISEANHGTPETRRLSYIDTTPVTIREVYTKPRSMGYESGTTAHDSDRSESNLSKRFENFDWNGSITGEEEKGYESNNGAGSSSHKSLEENGDDAHNLPMLPDEDEDADGEGWLDGEGESEKGSQSYSALSKRAELILENAKKRLMLMEDNLRGARHSLLVTPSTSLTSLRIASEININSFKNRHARSALGFTTGRFQDALSTSNPTIRSPGHSRGFSDTSFIDTRQSHSAVLQPEHDITSAEGPMNHIEEFASRDEKLTLPITRPIRSSRSQEALRDSRLSSWGLRYDHQTCNKAPEIKPNLESLIEDEAAGQSQINQTDTVDGSNKRISPSASELRTQMNDLKGRISSLQQRTREDNEKRRSMQSLQSLNTYTAAEAWYTGAEGYKVGAAGADAGIGWSPTSPRTPNQETREYDDSRSSPLDRKLSHSRKDSTDVLDEGYEGTGEAQLLRVPEDWPESPKGFLDQNMDSNYEPHNKARNKSVESELDYNSKLDEGDEGNNHLGPDGKVEAADDDDNVTDGGTIYEEADPYLSSSERHEDRVDAFDYENFFLHSAMGTYSRLSRHSSFSSAESTETTKPEASRPYAEGTIPGDDGVTEINNRRSTEDDVPPLKSQPTSPKLQYTHRNYSITSISSATTTASFATAAEGQAAEHRRGWDSPSSPVSPASPSTPRSQILTANVTQAVQTIQHSRSTRLPSANPPASPPTYPHIATQLSPQRRGGSIGSASTTGHICNGHTKIVNDIVSDSPTGSAGNYAFRPHKPRPRPVSTVVSNLLDESRSNDSSRMHLPPGDKALVYSLAESLRFVCSNLQEAVQQMPGKIDDAHIESSGNAKLKPDLVWRNRLARAKQVLDGEGEETLMS